MLREMLKLFKGEYAAMIFKLGELGHKHFTVEEEFFVPDKDLKEIAQPVRKRKVIEIKEQGNRSQHPARPIKTGYFDRIPAMGGKIPSVGKEPERK